MQLRIPAVQPKSLDETSTFHSLMLVGDLPWLQDVAFDVNAHL